MNSFPAKIFEIYAYEGGYSEISQNVHYEKTMHKFPKFGIKYTYLIILFFYDF